MQLLRSLHNERGLRLDPDRDNAGERVESGRFPRHCARDCPKWPEGSGVQPAAPFGHSLGCLLAVRFQLLRGVGRPHGESGQLAFLATLKTNISRDCRG
ncbi:MAG: hypothetical protein MZV70_22500 [Desulfobacterales bacterium]|nr:hypothetical protein [Desulfobacterales bacterium]